MTTTAEKTATADEVDEVDKVETEPVAGDAAKTTDAKRPKAKPDYTLTAFSTDFPDDAPSKAKGPRAGGAPRGQGRSITNLLTPICADTALWSVEGQEPVVLRVVDYTTIQGAKAAIKNIAEHPEKLPYHDGGKEAGCEWEFADVKAYRQGEDGKDVAGSRHGQLYAKYLVSAEEYLRVTAGPNHAAVQIDGYDPADPDAGYDEAGNPV